MSFMCKYRITKAFAKEISWSSMCAGDNMQVEVGDCFW